MTQIVIVMARVIMIMMIGKTQLMRKGPDSTGTSLEICNVDLGLLLKPFFDNVLLEHGGLPLVLSLAVHLDCLC